ncbi:MAG: RidA family protein [Granulosicoccus sp.]|nr:RidA family protein [Granulosicoccus sp.]
MIERIAGTCAGRSTSTAYKDLVFTVATATDESMDIVGQTAQALAMLDRSLGELGSDKQKILSAQVFLAKIADKPVMDQVWLNWIGSDSERWPQRACLGVELEENYLIEITVVAVR